MPNVREKFIRITILEFWPLQLLKCAQVLKKENFVFLEFSDSFGQADLFALALEVAASTLYTVFPWTILHVASVAIPTRYNDQCRVMTKLRLFLNYIHLKSSSSCLVVRPKEIKKACM